MNSLHKSLVLLLVVLSAAALVACGDGPLSASKQGVVLRGTLVGNGSAGASAFSAGSSSADVITVTVVEDPSITATVGADGTFTLRGLPTGSFTLEFKVNGVPAGTHTFSEVKPNQEITITVQFDGTTVTVVEEKRNGIGHGDVEIEGLVEAVLVLDPAGESRFTINAHTVVARPGETSIREGNQRRTVADVTVGRQVHVKGVFLEADPTTGVQPVLAHEIKLQDADDGDDDNDATKTCLIEGGKVGQRIELEGKVDSGTADAFKLKVNGNRAKGLVDVSAASAAFQCSGGKNAPPDCKATVVAGTRVHVSGTLTSCSLTAAAVDATKVIVQK